ncbi:MAG TPA: hypothetical protein VMT19_09560 [Thermoanaerobaculaceae bacterium]|nr:hypothetical protein [Thermoanaerobaculaceae bacterium]
MKMFLQILLTVGLLAFAVGVVEAFAGKVFMFSPQGYWRGAMAMWVLLVATRLTYLENK